MTLLLVLVVSGGCRFYLRFLWAMHQELKVLKSIPKASKVRPRQENPCATLRSSESH